MLLNFKVWSGTKECRYRKTLEPEAMYTESAFRRQELEGSGGEKQPEEGMESAEFLSAGMRFVIRSDWHSFYV